jgi:DNA ligase-1
MSDFPVMLARAYEAKRVTDWSSLVVEPKLDGVRVVAKVSASGRVQFFSRTGRVLTMFDSLIAPTYESVTPLAVKHGHLMVDGEMRSDSGRFEDISGDIHRKDHLVQNARFHVFFAMPWERFRFGADDLTQFNRMELLENRWHQTHDAVRLLKYTFVTAHPMIEAAYESYREEGHEGIMIKQVHTPYGGRRSHDWMKMKGEETVDVRVFGLERGQGKYRTMLGALIVVYNGRKVKVSGMTDAQRTEWWKHPKRIIGKMIEVRFQHVTEQGSLRHPRFVRLRPDKD